MEHNQTQDDSKKDDTEWLLHTYLPSFSIFNSERVKVQTKHISSVCLGREKREMLHCEE